MALDTPERLRLYRDIAKPLFASWLPFVIALAITYPIRLGLRLRKSLRKIYRPEQSHTSLLCLESGVKGWEIIEYKELHQSALEYVGEDRVIRFVVTDEAPYLAQLKHFLNQHPVTHYAWSPRTGEQHRFKGLVEALQVSIILSRRGIVPIALLTDLLVRTWRTTSSIVTASSGVVVTLMSPSDVSLICPHRRFIGPYIMSFSKTTLDKLEAARQIVNDNQSAKDAITLGALYEPRKAIVESIQKHLRANKHDLIIKGRSLMGERSSDEEYWSRMVNAKIVVTTSNVLDEADDYDWMWKKHFVYRYLEVMACGSLLVAPDLPGIERYFQPGVHFVSFLSEKDAAKKVQYYLENNREREQISLQGFERVKNLVESRSFWLGLDTCLSHESIL
ncbi:MAG: glycosyltransferase [Gammaproteobacteria bacterium]|nr:glycosyltransferase [Gammaproteobacteria bacterium]